MAPTPSPIRFGLIGCGNIGSRHAQVIASLEEATLVAVCNRRLEPAERLGEEYGAEVYNHYAELLRREDLDVVSIATPSGSHLEPVIAAAEAGKHVICEKPLEVTLDRVDRMIAACDAAKVLLAAIFPLRFSVGARMARDAIASGRLGPLVLAEAHLRWWRSQEYYDSGGWRGTWALDGGGVLMNQAIHRLDLLQWIAGPIDRVSATAGTLAHERIEVEDVAVGLARFQSGALGSIIATTATRPGFPSRIGFYGLKGAIELEEHAITRWKFDDALPDEEQEVTAMFQEHILDEQLSSKAVDADGHRQQFADMVSAIRNQRHPEVDGRGGRHAVALVRGLYESAASGGWVRVDNSPESSPDEWV